MMKDNILAENDILGNAKSRFSAEERAKLQKENFNVALKRKKALKAQSAGNADKTKEREKKRTGSSTVLKAKSNGRTTDGFFVKKRKKAKAATEKPGASRNENVKTSVKERKKETKRENIFIMFMLFFVIVTVCGILCVTALFKIMRIVINNNGIYTNEMIKQCAGIKPGDNLILIQTQKLGKKIEFELPYVEKAEIKKKFPDAIEINITYTSPAMAVATKTGYIYLSPNGKVLEANAEYSPDFAAVVKGVAVESAEPGKAVVFDAEKSAKDLVKLSKTLVENGVTGVSSYNFEEISDVRIIIDHRIELLLGPMSSAADKLIFGCEVIKRTIKSNAKDRVVINLRDKNKAYVKSKKDGGEKNEYGSLNEGASEYNTSGVSNGNENETFLTVG